MLTRQALCSGARGSRCIQQAATIRLPATAQDIRSSHASATTIKTNIPANTHTNSPANTHTTSADLPHQQHGQQYRPQRTRHQRKQYNHHHASDASNLTPRPAWSAPSKILPGEARRSNRGVLRLVRKTQQAHDQGKSAPAPQQLPGISRDGHRLSSKVIDKSNAHITRLGKIIPQFLKSSKGGRWLQSEIEAATGRDKELLENELIKHSRHLMTSRLGCFVAQQSIVVGSPAYLHEIAKVLQADMMAISMDDYGCYTAICAIKNLPKPERNNLLADWLLPSGNVATVCAHENTRNVLRSAVTMLERELAVSSSSSSSSSSSLCEATVTISNKELLDNIEVMLNRLPLLTELKVNRRTPTGGELFGQVSEFATDSSGEQVLRDIIRHPLTDSHTRARLLDEILAISPFLIRDIHGSMLISKTMALYSPDQLTKLLDTLLENINDFAHEENAHFVVRNALSVLPEFQRNQVVSALLDITETEASEVTSGGNRHLAGSQSSERGDSSGAGLSLGGAQLGFDMKMQHTTFVTTTAAFGATESTLIIPDDDDVLVTADVFDVSDSLHNNGNNHLNNYTSDINNNDTSDITNNNNNTNNKAQYTTMQNSTSSNSPHHRGDDFLTSVMYTARMLIQETTQVSDVNEPVGDVGDTMSTGPDGQLYPSSNSLLKRFNAIAETAAPVLDNSKGSISNGSISNGSLNSGAALSDLKRTGREPPFAEMLDLFPEFASDECGSQYVQKLFQNGSEDERSYIVMQLLLLDDNMMCETMCDRYGKFVIMCILQHGSINHQKVLAEAASKYSSHIAGHRHGHDVYLNLLDHLPKRESTELISGLIFARGELSSRAKDLLGARALHRSISHCQSHIAVLEALKTDMENEEPGSWQGSNDAETLTLANRLVEHAEVLVADALLPLATQVHASHVVKQVFVGRRTSKTRQGGESGAGSISCSHSDSNGSNLRARSSVKHVNQADVDLDVKEIMSIQKLAKSLERNCEALSQHNLGNQILQSVIECGVPEHANVVYTFIHSHMLKLMTDKYGAFLICTKFQNQPQNKVDEGVHTMIAKLRSNAASTAGDSQLATNNNNNSNNMYETSVASELANLSRHTCAKHVIRVALESSSPSVAAELKGLIDTGNTINTKAKSPSKPTSTFRIRAFASSLLSSSSSLFESLRSRRAAAASRVAASAAAAAKASPPPSPTVSATPVGWTAHRIRGQSVMMSLTANANNNTNTNTKTEMNNIWGSSRRTNTNTKTNMNSIWNGSRRTFSTSSSSSSSSSSRSSSSSSSSFSAQVGEKEPQQPKFQECRTCEHRASCCSLTCPSCNALLPVALSSSPSHSCNDTCCSCSYFDLLKLPESYALENPKQLDRNFWNLQKQLHPDNFGAASTDVQDLSASHCALINHAYETLKDPLKRAKYVLKLKGRGKIFDEDDVGTGSFSTSSSSDESRWTTTDPMMLMQVMGDREALEECHDVDGLDALLKDARQEVESLTTRLGVLFEQEDLDEAQKHVLRLVYASKLVEEIREKKLQMELNQ